MGALLGLVNDNFHTDQFNAKGAPLPDGTPQVRRFVERDYALYAGDTYRATRELTLNFGSAGRISGRRMRRTDSRGRPPSR